MGHPRHFKDSITGYTKYKYKQINSPLVYRVGKSLATILNCVHMIVLQWILSQSGAAENVQENKMAAATIKKKMCKIHCSQRLVVKPASETFQRKCIGIYFSTKYDRKVYDIRLIFTYSLLHTLTQQDRFTLLPIVLISN